MIEFIDVNYRVADYVILTGINLKIHKGECLLLAGESGSGKTTLTKLINGLIPHFYSNGQLNGGVSIQGEKVAETEIYRLAEKIGSVFQTLNRNFFIRIPLLRLHSDWKTAVFRRKRFDRGLRQHRMS